MDSTLVSALTGIIEQANTEEIMAVGNLLKAAQRSLAMQWFIGNCFFLTVAAAFGVVVYLMGKQPKSASEETPASSMSTKKFAAITGIFVLGLICSQILLQLIGILAWCALFGIGIAIHLKGKTSWFVRRGHGIPVGWSLLFFLVVVIMILAFNVFPTISSLVVTDAAK